MGAFFANVQVHTAGRPSDIVHATVREALRSWVLDGTLEEVDSATPDDDIERLILLGPPGGEPWIAVFHEASDDQDSSQLDALAAMLSEATQTAAVGALVRDDSILRLTLFSSGEARDYDNSRPDYFGEQLTDADRAAARGQPAQWTNLLAPGVTIEEFSTALRTPDQFADRQLAQVAGLLGCDRSSPPIASAISVRIRESRVCSGSRFAAHVCHRKTSVNQPGCRAFSPWTCSEPAYNSRAQSANPCMAGSAFRARADQVVASK